MNKTLLSIINTVLENNDLNRIGELNSKSDLQNDLGLDSIMLAELTVRIEDEFDVDIFERGMVHSVGDILKILEKK